MSIEDADPCHSLLTLIFDIRFCSICFHFFRNCTLISGGEFRSPSHPSVVISEKKMSSENPERNYSTSLFFCLGGGLFYANSGSDFTWHSSPLSWFSHRTHRRAKASLIERPNVVAPQPTRSKFPRVSLWSCARWRLLSL